MSDGCLLSDVAILITFYAVWSCGDARSGVVPFQSHRQLNF